MPKEGLMVRLRVLRLVLLGCGAWIGMAQASGYLPPRLSVEANAGGSATVGQADLLLSLKGDERRTLYLDPQVAYGSDEQWYSDLGLGYRWIQNEAAILGGYVFASRTHVENQAGFWIANPGVEALGSRWDARINGYIPIGGCSDDLGVFQFIQSRQFIFTEHTVSLLTTSMSGDKSQQIGDGIDARVGYQVFRGLPFKAYLGAYFFAIPHTDNVRGGAAGVEYWMDRNVKVFAHYTYDNLQHSTVVGGLALSFGGVDEARADPSLSERLMDPVERYLANLGHGAGIPSETLLDNMKRVLNTRSINQPLLIDVAFFSQTGRPNNGGVGLGMTNCTFANPCGPTDFSQTGVNTLNSLLPNTTMFFNGGTYPATNGTSGLTLNNGQGVFGRSANYSAPASGAARPTFNGAFTLTGNNTLDSLILNNSLGPATTAITSTGGQNLQISNSTIGSAANPYGMAMNLTNASATLMGSSVNTNIGSAVTAPLGIFGSGILLSGSSLVVQSSSLNIATANPPNNVAGVFLNNNSSLVLNNSQLAVGASVVNGKPVVGIAALGVNSVATINNSRITVNSTTDSLSTIGLLTDVSTILMNSGSIAVSGKDADSTDIRQGTNITIVRGVVCTGYEGLNVSC